MLCTEPKIAVIGYGSWATALVGLITSNGHKVNWHIRNKDILESVNEEGINPKYLSELELDNSLIEATSDINENTVTERKTEISPAPFAPKSSRNVASFAKTDIGKKHTAHTVKLAGMIFAKLLRTNRAASCFMNLRLFFLILICSSSNVCMFIFAV